MRIGILGGGKLGSPVALAFESKGHDVLVTDKAEWVQQAFANKKWPHRERGVPELMEKTKIRCVPISELVCHSEIIFVAVQTPHEHQYGGAVPLPADRKDFDYTHLKAAMLELVHTVYPPPSLHYWTEEKTPLPFVTAVISTVLPGTMRREILPLLPAGSLFVYCPFFAAMGTVVEDGLDPEFVVLGHDYDPSRPDEPDLDVMQRFFWTLHHAEVIPMSIESAELTKVAYNLAISQKIVMANAIMEIAHKVPGCDVEEVTEALKQATDRIVSPRYMDGGMGDGGGCHPRDGIAMSWLCDDKRVSANPFEDAVSARECQATWLAGLFSGEAGDLPLVLLGKAYKPESGLVDGSPALLIAAILKSWKRVFLHYDPHVDGNGVSIPTCQQTPVAYLICTKHECFKDYKFPPGSIVVDVFRFIGPQDGVKIISVGRGT